jgi:hypothetical protein
MQTDITFSLAQTVWIVGSITAIIAFLKWAMTPIKKLENHETRISALEEGQTERKATERYIMSALNALINHTIDGNNTEELKRVRDSYQEQIIKHHE